MKTQLTTTAAAAVALLLSAGPTVAAESPFNVPDTAEARQSAEVLTRSARIFSDSRWASTLAARGTQISNVWLYPTADTNTVFTKYTLTNEGEASASEHLALLTVRADGNVGVRELANDTRPSAGPHWSAAIGTGHSPESTKESGTDHGTPALPHWTASIGTGSAPQSASREVKASAQPQQSVASAHWASKIGTGQASDSKDRATQAAPAVVAAVSELSE